MFHDGSATFTTGNFECMVCLKKFPLQKPEVKKRLDSRHGKVNLREVGYDAGNWIDLVQDRDQWRA